MEKPCDTATANRAMDFSDSFSSLDESLDEVIDITNENVPTNTSRNGRSASVTGTDGTNYGRDRSKQKLDVEQQAQSVASSVSSI